MEYSSGGTLGGFFMNNCPENVGSILMQFTGLKDKNGKEIYEGDIMRVTPDLICEVEYRAPVFGRTFYGDNLWECDDPPRFNQCEVIGNIHENPELLEPQKENTK